MKKIKNNFRPSRGVLKLRKTMCEWRPNSKVFVILCNDFLVPWVLTKRRCVKAIVPIFYGGEAKEKQKQGFNFQRCIDAFLLVKKKKTQEMRRKGLVWSWPCSWATLQQPTSSILVLLVEVLSVRALRGGISSGKWGSSRYYRLLEPTASWSSVLSPRKEGSLKSSNLNWWSLTWSLKKPDACIYSCQSDILFSLDFLFFFFSWGNTLFI